MNFNEIIRKSLSDKKISAYQLSKDLKINQGQLSRFLNYNDQLSTKNLQRIFDYLKIIITEEI